MYNRIKKYISSHLLAQLLFVSIISWIALLLIQYVFAHAVPKFLFESDIFKQYWETEYEETVIEFQNYVIEHDLTRDEAYMEAFRNAVKADIKFGSYASSVMRCAPDGLPTMVQCKDGIFEIHAYAPSRIYWGRWMYVGLGGAVIASELIIAIYAITLLKRVKKLCKQVLICTPENEGTVIGIDGEDELAALGKKVEHMRQRIVHHMGNEIEILEQQRALTTSLSHDIRTPLMKIISSVEVLNLHILKTEEEKEKYLAIIASNATQLKKLTDELMNRLVSEKSEVNYPMVTINGPEALSQILYEESCAAELEGFTVNLPQNVAGEWNMNMNAVAVKRVADNILSNLNKYADQAYPIDVMVEEDTDKVVLLIQNRKRKILDESKIQSYGLGIENIKDILHSADCKLYIENRPTTFCMKIAIPKQNS